MLIEKASQVSLTLVAEDMPNNVREVRFSMSSQIERHENNLRKGNLK